MVLGAALAASLPWKSLQLDYVDEKDQELQHS